MLKQLTNYVKNWFKQYHILVGIGFTMYNYARDAMNRYAMPSCELSKSFELSDEYRNIVNQFLGRFDAHTRRNFHHLGFLADAIHVALVIATSSTNEEDQRLSAMKMCTSVVNLSKTESNVPCPATLIGLHYYLCGKLQHLNKNFGMAWFSYTDAVKSLKSWKDSKASQASYYYDVIFGEYKVYSPFVMIFNVFIGLFLKMNDGFQ